MDDDTRLHRAAMNKSPIVVQRRKFSRSRYLGKNLGPQVAGKICVAEFEACCLSARWVRQSPPNVSLPDVSGEQNGAK